MQNIYSSDNQTTISQMPMSKGAEELDKLTKKLSENPVGVTKKQSKEKKGSKLFTFASIAVLLLVAFTIGFNEWEKNKASKNLAEKPQITTEKKEEPQSNLEYSNKYFEFTYSANYKIQESTNQISLWQNDSEQINKAIVFFIEDNPNNLPFDEWLKTLNVTSSILKPSSELLIKDVLIGNNTWQSVEESEIPLGFPPSGNIYWAIVHMNKIVLVGLENLSIAERKEDVYKILSTFQFIDLTETSAQENTHTDEKSTENQFCGGIANIPCSEGYECILDGNYPDAGGTCKQVVL